MRKIASIYCLICLVSFCRVTVARAESETSAAPTSVKAGVPVQPGGDPNDPKSGHPVGIYLYQELDAKPKMTKVDPSTIERVKSTGGFFAIYGEHTKQKAVLPGPRAALQLQESRPTFFFYFLVGSDTQGQEGPTPNDFTLAQMQVKDDRRRLTIGKHSLYSKTEVGVDPKSVVAFTSEKVSAGIYKVTMANDLPAGEYCFLLGHSNSSAFTSSLGTGGELFCFGVHAAEASKKR